MTIQLKQEQKDDNGKTETSNENVNGVF